VTWKEYLNRKSGAKCATTDRYVSTSSRIRGCKKEIKMECKAPIYIFSHLSNKINDGWKNDKKEA